MSLALRRSDFYIADFEIQARWYVREGGLELGQRYLDALESTLKNLCSNPALGRERRFRNPKLKGIRSFRVNPPFNQHLIFYRFDASALYAERAIHGARDLPRRLLQSPGVD